jgi:hypothetical protein
MDAFLYFTGGHPFYFLNMKTGSDAAAYLYFGSRSVSGSAATKFHDFVQDDHINLCINVQADGGFQKRSTKQGGFLDWNSGDPL